MTLKKKMMEEYVKGIIKENNKKQQNLYWDLRSSGILRSFEW
jgi:hypothetical protein